MWKLISSKEIFKHPRLTLIEDEVILPSGIKTFYLRFKDTGDCCATIIARKNGKILVQKEFSYPVGEKIFQFPGGGVRPDEKPEDGANREFMEECGYKATNFSLLGSYLMSNRRSKQKMYIFLTDDFKEISLPEDNEESDIENIWLSEKEIDDMIKNDQMDNIHLLASWSLYQKVRGN